MKRNEALCVCVCARARVALCVCARSSSALALVLIHPSSALVLIHPSNSESAEICFVTMFFSRYSISNGMERCALK
jgi:hypothetical protein